MNFPTSSLGLLLLASFPLVGCGADGAHGENADADLHETTSALQASAGYLVFASTLPGATGTGHRAYVKSVNGGSLVCGDGTTAFKCPASLTLTSVKGNDGVKLDGAEQSALFADFLAGNVVVYGQLGKAKAGAPASLSTTSAWRRSAGASSSTTLYVVTPIANCGDETAACPAYVATTANATTTHKVVDVDFGAHLGLVDRAAQDAHVEIAEGGALLRGPLSTTAKARTLAATDFLTRVQHVPALGPTNLDATETTTVLRVIDDVCGDTWCDGDDDFRFQGLACTWSTSSCTLRLLVIAPSTATVAQRTFEHVCTLHGIAAYTDAVTTTGAYSHIAAPMMAAMATCIDEAHAATDGQ